MAIMDKEFLLALLKKSLPVLALLILLIISFFTPHKNYCKWCDGDHVACNNDRKFQKNCPESANLVKMTQFYKNEIVRLHNKYRDVVASGSTTLEKACNMATMCWDDELSYVAEFNVKQCLMKHDRCRKTEKFPSAGQNLAMMRTSKTDYPEEEKRLAIVVRMWFSEISKATQDAIDKLTSDNWYEIGHFTVMMQEDNTHVGCAAIYYSSAADKHEDYLVACNYAGNNLMDSPVYKKCDKSGSGCKNGLNPQYKHLCARE